MSVGLGVIVASALGQGACDVRDEGKGPCQVEGGEIILSENRPELPSGLSSEGVAFSLGHVDGIVARYGQLLGDEFNHSRVGCIQAARAHAVVDVVEIPDRQFTAGKRRPEFFGVGFAVGQHRHRKGRNGGGPPERIGQERAGRQRFHGLQDRLADAELHLDRFVLAGH